MRDGDTGYSRARADKEFTSAAGNRVRWRGTCVCQESNSRSFPFGSAQGQDDKLRAASSII